MSFLSSPIHHCVSLGPSCHAAEFLRWHGGGTRRFALPFDWIHSDLSLVNDCLSDGCKALLDRSMLDSSMPGRDRALDEARRARSKRCLHRRYRTQAHAHIFQHHDPATCDEDYAKLHRAADRLRRLLADSDSRSLFFHLETNASPHGSRRQRFVMDSIATYDTLRGCTANFAMLALRCVTANDHGIRGIREGIREGGADAYDDDGHADGSITAREGPRGERELFYQSDEDDNELVVLEMDCLTKTVVPFSRLSQQGTAEELEDMSNIAAAVNARFAFAGRDQPPSRTEATDATRAACGPGWLWARPLQGPAGSCSVAELRHATALLRQAAPPDESVLTLLVEAAEAEDVTERHTIDVAAWSAAWVQEVGIERVRVREVRAAAKRLALPSRRAPSHDALVATVLGYQLAELRTAAGCT